MVSGSTDQGDYAHSITDEAQAKAFAEKVAGTLDARAKALKAYEVKMAALFGDDVAEAVKAFA